MRRNWCTVGSLKKGNFWVLGWEYHIFSCWIMCWIILQRSYLIFEGSHIMSSYQQVWGDYWWLACSVRNYLNISRKWELLCYGMEDLLDFGVVTWCRCRQFKRTTSGNRVFKAYGFWDAYLKKHHRQVLTTYVDRHAL